MLKGQNSDALLRKKYKLPRKKINNPNTLNPIITVHNHHVVLYKFSKVTDMKDLSNN